MKNVQTYLKELDREKQIDYFLERDPVPYTKPEWSHRPVSDVTEYWRKEISGFIDRLCNLEIKPSKDGECIFFVHYIMENFYKEPCFSLVHLNEFKTDPYNAYSYAYEFQNQAEIVGYLVAETPLTLEYIYELMADIMYEASFFGFEQEDLTEEKEKLLQAKEAMEKANEDRFVSFNEYKESIGWKDEAADPEAEKLRNAVWDAVSAYNNYSDKKERKLLVSMLMPGESDKANNA